MTNYTRIIDNVKYIALLDDNNFKMLSLEDNVYFTLRDIFWNMDNCDLVMDANRFNEKLTNNISYEDRNETFCYTDILNDKNYIHELSKWLEHIKPCYFEFERDFFETDINNNEIIKFDDWLIQLENLKILIKERYDTLHELNILKNII
jgi:hypothetical protein